MEPHKLWSIVVRLVDMYKEQGASGFSVQRPLVCGNGFGIRIRLCIGVKEIEGLATDYMLEDMDS